MSRWAAGAALAVLFCVYVCPAVAADLFVLSQGAGVVTQMDAGGAALRTIVLGGKPARLARAPERDRVYVSDPDGGRVSAVADGKVEARFDLKAQPFGIGVIHDALLVADWSSGRLVKLDRRSGRPIASVVVGRAPADLVIGPLGRAYVADRGGDDVAVVDVASMRVLDRIAVGGSPFALALSPDGRWLYVANVRDGDVSIVDTRAMKSVGRIAVGPMPYGLALTVDGSMLLVTVQHAGALRLVDTRTRTVIGSVAVGRYPEGVVCDARGRAYVANWFSDDVSIVDLAARREVKRVKVADGPRSLVFGGEP